MNQLSKKLMCIQMRSGVELWIESERAETLQDALEKITSSKFVRFDERTINTADIVGVFTALDMQDLVRRKNGQWRCQHGTWHDQKENCSCVDKLERDRREKQMAAINACSKCTNGFAIDENGIARTCECIRGL